MRTRSDPVRTDQGGRLMPVDPLNSLGASRDELIRHRAYHLYEQHGRQDGHEVDDWLAAERELAAESQHSR